MNNWLKVWKTWAKQANYSEDIKSYSTNQKTIILLQVDEAKQRQDRNYSNAISAATGNRSQIKTHDSKQVYFNSVQQIWTLMEGKM